MKKIFEPITMNDLTLHNRIVMPPMATAKTKDGKVTSELISYYEEKSKGGYLGLIITEHCYINLQGKAHDGQVSIASNEDIKGLTQIADTIHANGCKAFVQINHAGRSTGHSITGLPPISASALPNKRFENEMSEEMTQAQINAVIQDFVAAAMRVKAAGFDGVEIHSAHTYLLNQFYSPLTNKRTDSYSGNTLEGRLKIHKEIISAVRAAVGTDLVIALRLGGCDYTKNGSTIEDSVQASKLLESYGVDLLDISGGMNGYTIPGHNEPGYFSEMTEKIKANVSIPVILTGGVTTADEAEQLLKDKKADLIGVGRAIFKNSKWAEEQLAKPLYDTIP